MSVRSLSFHAHYRCRHNGACCTANWPIPVEADRLAVMHAAAANARLRPADFVEPATPNAPVLLRVVAHECVFFDAEQGRTCGVHTALGHDALPLACRQFPRVVVTDPRGVSVVLSHFCPTAAAMLTEPGTFRSRVAIVENPPAFPADGEYVGLDARDSLPPLLRPDVLMDWESWWEFERRAVEMLGNSTDPPDATLLRLRQIVEDIRTWSPGQGALLARVEEAFGAKADLEVGPTYLLNRFLAAHAFANWTAHLGQGLRSWLLSIEAAHELMTSGHDVRQADLRLRHLSDPYEMARTWSAAETESAR